MRTVFVPRAPLQPSDVAASRTELSTPPSGDVLEVTNPIVPPEHYTLSRQVPKQLHILSDSFSVLGTKELALGDNRETFLRFCDTGGIFGQPVTRTFSFTEFCRKAELFLDPFSDRGRVIGRLRFDGEMEVVFTHDHPEELFTFILSLCDASTIPAIWFPAKLDGCAIFKSWLTEDTLWDEALCTKLFEEDCLPIRIECAAGRVNIYALNQAAAEIPQATAAFTLREEGRALECCNRFLVADVQLEGFNLLFPTVEFGPRYLRLIGLPVASEPQTGSANAPLVGLVGQVQVEGIIKGHRIESCVCDAQLDESVLRLFALSNPELCAVDLESPELAIDGTAEAFNLSPDGSTLIRVTSDSKPFLRTVYANKCIQVAAKRAASVGPFVTTNESGGFVRLETHLNEAVLTASGGTPTHLSGQIATPVYQTIDGRPCLEAGGHQLFAELPTLEGICSTLTGFSAQQSVAADFHGTVAEVIGLEGQYLTYCLFGKLAEIHILLTKTLGVDPETPLSLIKHSENKHKFLGVMSEVAVALSRECETLLYYFPKHVVDRDHDVLSSAGLSESLNREIAETAYKFALAGCGALIPHLIRIENSLSRFSSFRRVSAQAEGVSSLVPLGASLAGSLLNPLLLIGAVQQGAALYNRGGAKEAVAADTINELFTACSEEWDFIMHTLLPAVSSRFAQDVYPLRLATAHLFLKAFEAADDVAKETLVALVAQRLGRLRAFCQFPSSPASDVRRADCVDHLWQKQQNAAGFNLRPF